MKVKIQEILYFRNLLLNLRRTPMQFPFGCLPLQVNHLYNRYDSFENENGCSTNKKRFKKKNLKSFNHVYTLRLFDLHTA